MIYSVGVDCLRTISTPQGVLITEKLEITMHNILHRIVIETTPDKLYRALTTQQGLSAWWTKNSSNGDNVGSAISFLFGPDGSHQVDMQIKALKSNELVVWQCVAGPWTETGLFTFSISADERGAVLHFSHQGWNETNDFYQHCNSKWGFFLAVSLKSYLEIGEGQPHPRDPNI
jgi:uncharacterized protein YndB with AHSA1/START domain